MHMDSYIAAAVVVTVLVSCPNGQRRDEPPPPHTIEHKGKEQELDGRTGRERETVANVSIDMERASERAQRPQ